jgi:hypothetical protein
MDELLRQLDVKARLYGDLSLEARAALRVRELESQVSNLLASKNMRKIDMAVFKRK